MEKPSHHQTIRIKLSHRQIFALATTSIPGSPAHIAVSAIWRHATNTTFACIGRSEYFNLSVQASNVRMPAVLPIWEQQHEVQRVVCAVCDMHDVRSAATLSDKHGAVMIARPSLLLQNSNFTETC